MPLSAIAWVFTLLRKQKHKAYPVCEPAIYIYFYYNIQIKNMQPPAIKLTVFNPIYNNKQIKTHNFFVDIKNIFYLCSRKEAQMAESVDALVSNTSGATRAGSTPALGTNIG